MKNIRVKECVATCSGSWRVPRSTKGTSPLRGTGPAVTPGQALAAGGRGGGRRRRFFTRLQTSTPAPGTLTCRVTGTVSSWNSGPTANLTLTNTGITAINGGFLAFTLPGGQVVPFGWNTACAPASGWMRAKSVTRNGTIVPGASAGIGFQAARTGDTASPDWCSLQRHGLCR